MSSAEKSATDLVTTDEPQVRAPGATTLSLRREVVSVFRAKSGLRAGLACPMSCAGLTFRVCAPTATGVHGGGEPIG